MATMECVCLRLISLRALFQLSMANTSAELDEMRTRLHLDLDAIIDKYIGKQHMMSRLHAGLTEHLPNALMGYEARTIERAERETLLTKACLDFTTKFINDNGYFRCEGSGTFVKYEGEHVRDADEDDIQHHILTDISQSSQVAQRKHKTKAHIMKKLKGRSLLIITPEEETIQYVLASLHPAFFLSTAAARHFLCAIGESLLGERDLTYICPPVLRELFRIIEDAASEFLGMPTALSHFKKKYHGHEHANLRFFLCDFQREPAAIPRHLRSHVLDVLVVAVHAARTWGSADHFVDGTLCQSLSEVTNFSRDRTREQIVDKFVADSLVACEGAVMTSGEAWFALRDYFKRNNLPVILFQDEFQTTLGLQIHFQEGVYVGFTSPCLPIVRSFGDFWGETMTASTTAYPLEIESIITLFSHISGNKPAARDLDFFRSLISHLYPSVLIEGWTVRGQVSSVWPKNSIVRDLCTALRDQGRCPATVPECYDMYLNGAGAPVIKRSEFGLILKELFPQHVPESGIIVPDMWFTSVV